MIRAIVFDFDGLIVDTELPEFQAWQEIYEAHGSTLSFAVWATCIGTVGAFDPYAYLEEQLGRAIDRPGVQAQQRQRCDTLIAAQAVLPGVHDYLAEARRLGLHVGVASSSSRAWVHEHSITSSDRAELAPIGRPGVTRDGVDKRYRARNCPRARGRRLRSHSERFRQARGHRRGPSQDHLRVRREGLLFACRHA